MKFDFKGIVDSIFSNKNMYQHIEDVDKELNFFIINRKFAFKFFKQAKFFNHKNIDKASSLDIWYNFFKNEKSIPGWYWGSKSNKDKIDAEKEKKLPSKDRQLLLEYNDNLNDREIDFLLKYYPEEIKEELKKIHKHEKSQN